MADNGERIGIGIRQQGQSTSESTGGYGANIREPLAHLRLLVLRRILEGLYAAVWAPLIVGPWILALYVPATFGWALPQLGRWFWPDEEQDRVDPWSLVSIGAVVALIVALTPRELLAWWPLRWVWAQYDPRWLWIRALLVGLPLLARREVRLVDMRQRQEIVAPTLSGVAYSQPAPHLVRFAGYDNPFRDPAAPALPARAPEVTRALFWRPDSGGANGARIVDCPADVANGMQLEELAHLVIELGIPPTRAQVMRRGIFSDPGWRAFVDWCVERKLMVKTGEARSAPYVMSEEGAAWLTTLVEGEPA